MTEANINHTNFGHIHTRWHKAGVFQCNSIHAYIEDIPRQQPEQSLQNYSGGSQTLNSRKTTCSPPSSPSAPAPISIIDAFDEESVSCHMKFEDQEDRAQIKLYKKVYGTMLKNNLVSYDQSQFKRGFEKQPISNNYREKESQSNPIRKIKSTNNIANRSSINNYNHYGKRRTVSADENSLKNYPTVVMSPTPQKSNVLKNKPLPSHHKYPVSLVISNNDVSQQRMTSQNGLVNKRLDSRKIHFQDQRDLFQHEITSVIRQHTHQPMTSFQSIDYPLRSNTDDANLEQTIQPIQASVAPNPPTHHTDEILPQFHIPDLKLPGTSEEQLSAPRRTRKHIIFIGVLLFVVTVCVVSAVIVLTPGNDTGQSPKETIPPTYRILKVEVPFFPGNETSSKLHGKMSALSLEKVKRLMEIQVDEMFLRSNLSTYYCCNAVSISLENPPGVKSTITLAGTGESAASMDIANALGSLFVVTDVHDNTGAEMTQLAPCISCISMKYEVLTRRPKILLYSLDLT